jgi:putative restriction endonuclease
VPGGEHDRLVRLAAFQFLEEQSRIWGDVLPWRVLSEGLTFDGRRVPLVSQQGIFKPAVLADVPLSIRTTPIIQGRDRPYDDGMTPEGLLLYRYRGTDVAHRENAGLRRAMAEQIPLVHFQGITKGKYLASWPVYIVGDDPAALAFTVALAEPEALAPDLSLAVAEDARRSYYRAVTKRRLHQAVFRERVLHAYAHSCGICRLRHTELLDAAHILPDSHPRGEPVVPNGLALCKLHHAAFDTNILGIRPDLVIEVRNEVLLEHDGPMLRHGLQEVDGTSLTAPRRTEWKPGIVYLEERYEQFRKAG